MTGDQSNGSGEFHVLPVHIVSSAVGTPSPKRPRTKSTYRIITLVAGADGAGGTSSEQLLPASDKRLSAFVQALDDDCFISNNESDANSSTGLPLLATNLGPWPLDDQAAVYVACPIITGPTARVGVSATYLVD